MHKCIIRTLKSYVRKPLSCKKIKRVYTVKKKGKVTDLDYALNENSINAKIPVKIFLPINIVILK